MRLLTPEETKTIADKVRAMAVFCIERQGRCFKDWNPAKIYAYLAWNYLNGTTFVIYEGLTIKSMAIAFRVTHDELKDEKSIFDWRKLHQKGEATLVCDVFGNKKDCSALWDMVCQKWPEAKNSPVFTFRKGILKKIPERMYHA